MPRIWQGFATWMTGALTTCVLSLLNWKWINIANFCTKTSTYLVCFFCYFSFWYDMYTSVCRVDGLMWLNLDEDAWVDIGIDNKFYMRKMQLIMPQYVRSVIAWIYVRIRIWCILNIDKYLSIFITRRFQKRQERLRRGDDEEEEEEEEDDDGESIRNQHMSWSGSYMH
jgi:hypothetical protein